MQSPWLCGGCSLYWSNYYFLQATKNIGEPCIFWIELCWCLGYICSVSTILVFLLILDKSFYFILTIDSNSQTFFRSRRDHCIRGSDFIILLFFAVDWSESSWFYSGNFWSLRFLACNSAADETSSEVIGNSFLCYCFAEQSLKLNWMWVNISWLWSPYIVKIHFSLLCVWTCLCL